jgi:hypothetical protein
MIWVNPGANRAAYLAGVVALGLEQSSDLVTWAAVGVASSYQNGFAVFTVPLGTADFYRVSAGRASP